MVWRVYRSYHKVHSAGWGNVWCSRCDWREQPPLLILLVLLHDISGKDIPPLLKPSLVLSLSLFSVHPAFFDSSLPTLRSSCHFCPVSSLLISFFPLSTFPPSSLSLPPHCPPSCPNKHGRIWVCGKGGWCMWTDEVGAEIIAMAIHIKTIRRGRGGSAFTHFQSHCYSQSRRRV